MMLKEMFVYPRYPDNLSKLHLLAQNLWCTWHYEAIDLFYEMDPKLFRKVNHNPVEFLLSLPKERIEELSSDGGFIFELKRVWERFQDYMKSDGESGGSVQFSRDDTIAYFSMEFGLHECIPIYGGGLGILAGDFLKGASDIGLPVVGVGLLYKFGYFTQRVNINGDQEELYVQFDHRFIPVQQIRTANQEKAVIELKLLDQVLKIRLWQIDAGKTKLILMDTDIDENPPHLRDITSELYVTDREKRLQQEIVMGIGGVAALDYLGIEPKIYHINEGHSGFLVISRLRKLMVEKGLAFSQARALIRASTVFTTHTPVLAGNEYFKNELVERYVEPMLEDLGMTFDQFGPYGATEDESGTFCLPALAIRFARYVNGVSKIHRDVSRRMWSMLFPKTPLAEIPIDYVTNGVHNSWLSEPLVGLFSRHIGPDFLHHSDRKILGRIADIPDEEIWEAHKGNKQYLVNFVRAKLIGDLADRGYSQMQTVSIPRLFNPEYLTIVFARRFAGYKRATLILRDKDRLSKILSDPKRPVQLIFAGKAHPADVGGKNMIREITSFIRDYKLEGRVFFLENYDMNVARHLVWGADIWLNTPIFENEASGTSGIKAGMNGVLNLSVPDGWWPEGYNGKNGWSITAGAFYKNPDLREAAEAGQIYNLLEGEIGQLYYERNEFGIPQRWVGMMKESILSIYSKFNMNRVLLDYHEKFYLPAKRSIEKLCADGYRSLRDAAELEKQVLLYWDNVAFVHFSTSIDKSEYVSESDSVSVECTVNMGQAPLELFSVEVVYMRDNKSSFRIMPMKLQKREGSLAYYSCSFRLEGYGMQNMDARIRPADEVVRDLYPELVKWAG